jgi:hypothetical protein
VVVDVQQIVVAAEPTADSPGLGHLEPTVRAAQLELRAVELTTGHRARRRQLLASAPNRDRR